MRCNISEYKEVILSPSYTQLFWHIKKCSQEYPCYAGFI
uniref:Uncharacterized protein n=1 Tax=Rhizophora mucronata TaxID=61149 RepID=A0A2P2JWU9_RHIMU